jgi:hypothetical protein
VSESEVIEAQRRDLPPEGYGFAARIVGLDPARFGQDASVLTLRQGPKVLVMRTYRGLDNMTLAALVADFIMEQKPDAVFIDSGGGAGVIDRLRQLNFTDVREVPFAGKASNDKRWANKRAEMYCRAAEWVREGGCLPPDQPELVADLSEPQYEYKNDAVQIEAKESIRARIGRSPDWGDSLALTFADPWVQPMFDPLSAIPGTHGRYGARHSALTTYDPYSRGLGQPYGDVEGGPYDTRRH